MEMNKSSGYLFLKFEQNKLTFAIGFPLCGLFFTGWGALLCDLYILLFPVSASGGVSLLEMDTHTNVRKTPTCCVTSCAYSIQATRVAVPGLKQSFKFKVKNRLRIKVSGGTRTVYFI